MSLYSSCKKYLNFKVELDITVVQFLNYGLYDERTNGELYLKLPTNYFFNSFFPFFALILKMFIFISLL